MTESIQTIFSWIWNNISNIDSLISVICFMAGIIVFAGGLVIGFLRLKLKRNRYKFLNMPIDRVTKQSMKYYIPTRGQETDPCVGKEYVENESFDLAKFFLKEIFPKSDEQYFIILADSGMGKTTFLLYLFLKYYKKILKKYSIVLIPLAFENAMEKINEIENKAATILLLDGFDEDRHAMIDYARRLEEICNATESFYKVIITCRTQFFPDSDSEPHKTNKIRFGTGKKGIEFKKYYLAPFCDKEVELYLKNKYKSLYEKNKIKRAKRIIVNCPDLIMRPMLLGYIDDLLTDETKEYTTVYAIYSELVRKWIEREPVDDEILYMFSTRLAEQMYADNTVYISQSDIEKLCEQYDIQLKSIEAKSKSLLNRNVIGDYRFAHKSIMEFFVANFIYDNWSIDTPVSWDKIEQYEMVKLFLKEKCLLDWNKLEEEDCRCISSQLFVSFRIWNLMLVKKEISRCEFVDCDFSKSCFAETTFREVRFVNVNFEEANFEDADLRKNDLRGAKWEAACLRNAMLDGCNLSGLCLIGADLTGADLTGADLTGADLRTANLKYADLTGANLKNADLRNAVLDFADLRGVDLTQTDLHNTQLDQAILKDVSKKRRRIISIFSGNDPVKWKIYNEETGELMEERTLNDM